MESKFWVCCCWYGHYVNMKSGHLLLICDLFHSIQLNIALYGCYHSLTVCSHYHCTILHYTILHYTALKVRSHRCHVTLSASLSDAINPSNLLWPLPLFTPPPFYSSYSPLPLYTPPIHHSLYSLLSQAVRLLLNDVQGGFNIEYSGRSTPPLSPATSNPL